MLPQHGGVPTFRFRLSGPVLLLLALVLITGLMLALSFHTNSGPGDLAGQNRAKLSLIVTLLLCLFILLAATGNWWHPHLWKQGNSQKHHRRRREQSRHRSKHSSRSKKDF